MAGCVLFASGKNFDVDSFLKSSQWRDRASTVHKGDKTGIKQRPHVRASGLQIELSDSEDNSAVQIEKATAFLEKNDSEMQRLKSFPGVEGIELRFGEWWYEDTAAFVLSLPPKLVALAGQHGAEMSVCVYATGDEQKQTRPGSAQKTVK